MADQEDKKTWHYSEGKTGVDQIPPDWQMAIGEIYSYGEIKYARNNWTKGTEWHQFMGSLLRHYFRWASGEDIDPESGKHHLLHVAWNAITLWFYQVHGLGKDDRLSTVLWENKNK